MVAQPLKCSEKGQKVYLDANIVFLKLDPLHHISVLHISTQNGSATNSGARDIHMDLHEDDCFNGQQVRSHVYAVEIPWSSQVKHERSLVLPAACAWNALPLYISLNKMHQTWMWMVISIVVSTFQHSPMVNRCKSCNMPSTLWSKYEKGVLIRVQVKKKSLRGRLQK